MTEKSQAEKVAYWTGAYHYWKAKMGDVYPKEFGKPQAFEDDPTAGFYRKGIYEKEENKRAKRIGWEPVAIWWDGGKLFAVVGGNVVAAQTIWTHVCGNPISEETYRAVAERNEPWPDSYETVASILVENSSGSMLAVPDGATGASPHNVISDNIDESAQQLAKFAVIESDEQSSKARSLQQRFLDLRGEAKKHYDALNDPLLAEQRRIRAVWFPLRDRADEAAGKLRDAMGEWENTKRKAAKLAQEAADKVARKHAEAARMAAESNQPPPPAPEPVKTNVPPPSSQIRGGGGKAASVRVEMVVTAIDAAKVFEQFKDDPRVIEFLTDLAQRAVRAGIAVPGATTEERSVVR